MSARAELISLLSFYANVKLKNHEVHNCKAVNRCAQLFMTDFRFKHQQCIDQDYQGVCITKFVISDANNLTEEQILEKFIRSPGFSFDSLREVVRQNPQKPYLEQAFNPDLLLGHDFRRASKNQAIKFLQDLEDGDNWGDVDKGDFILIKSQFLSILESVKTDHFFIINKDWFAKGNAKVRYPHDWVYIYYFIIIWIDTKETTLTISEWTYD